MKKKYEKFIINPSNLTCKLSNNNLRLIDCRWYLENIRKGKEEYLKNHIPGAIFFDIEKISDNSKEIPHMIPETNKFSKYLNTNNIEKKNSIVIYDQNGFFCSARVWFIFKLFGFKDVRILNGGYRLWIENKLKTTCDFKKNKKNETKVDIKKNRKMIASKKYLEKNLEKKQKLIIDARPEKRFLGIVAEPRKNLKKGKIKGSINIPFNTFVNENGEFKNLEYIKEFLDKKINFLNVREIVCSCGSGITACNIILALNLIGFNNIKLYDGSWAEWGKK